MEEIVVEVRHETCSTVSKIVKIKIMRKIIDDAPLQAGDILGFSCASSGSFCESKCSYKFLMDDY